MHNTRWEDQIQSYLKNNWKRLSVYSFAILTALITFFISYSYVHSYFLWKWRIWQERQHGMAELARAESNRKIKIWEADADLESAKRYADAEIIRARGVAEANQIIGDSLKGNEAYLRYRWIEGLQTNQMQVIYVPVEAGLPILEAGRCK